MKAKWIAIVAAVAVVAAAAAGFGGYRLGVNAGRTAATAARANFLAERGQGNTGTTGFPSQGGTGRLGGGQFNSANFAIGQVKQVDGQTLLLSTATEVLTVKLGEKTTLQKMGTASVSDLQPGERVTVQGTRAADGTMTAQSIQIGGGGPAAGGG